MAEIKLAAEDGNVIFEYDEKTWYCGIGNGEVLFGTIELKPEEWEALCAALRAATPKKVDGPDRLKEVRERLATALGEHRLRDDYLPTAASLKEREVALERRANHIELCMEAALDRLDRVLQGEDYIERWERAAEESNGAISFKAPRPEARPDYKTPAEEFREKLEDR